jgi:hypothetical protein
MLDPSGSGSVSNEYGSETLVNALLAIQDIFQAMLWALILVGSVRIKEGKNFRQNRTKKGEKISRAGCSLLRAKGFSCSLTVLYRGIGKKIKIFEKNDCFPVVKFYTCWTSR